MHDPQSQGNDYFRCDFCAQPWRDERPMVEGHHGSLICAACLSAAYADVVLVPAPPRAPAPAEGPPAAASPAEKPPAPPPCTMCLEHRPEPCWISPLRPEARICTRCIRQSATTLEHDEDVHWRRPAAS